MVYAFSETNEMKMMRQIILLLLTVTHQVWGLPECPPEIWDKNLSDSDAYSYPREIESSDDYDHTNEDSCIDYNGKTIPVLSQLHLKCGNLDEKPHFFKIEMVNKECADRRHKKFKSKGKMFGASSIGGGIWYHPFDRLYTPPCKSQIMNICFDSKLSADFSVGHSHIKGKVYNLPYLPRPENTDRYGRIDDNINASEDAWYDYKTGKTYADPTITDQVFIDRVSGLAWYVAAPTCSKYVETKLAALKDRFWHSAAETEKLSEKRHALRNITCLEPTLAFDDYRSNRSKDIRARAKHVDNRFGKGTYQACLEKARSLLYFHSRKPDYTLGKFIGSCEALSETEVTNQAISTYPHLQKKEPPPRPIEPPRPKTKF